MIGRSVLFEDEPLWANRLKVSASGRTSYKTAGVTIDWATVTAVSGADVVLNDGQIIAIGEKYIRYGTVIYKLGSGMYGVATEATTLIPGECFVMDYTITNQDLNSPLFGGATDNIDNAFKDRIVAGAGGGKPTWAQFYAAFPNITFHV